MEVALYGGDDGLGVFAGRHGAGEFIDRSFCVAGNRRVDDAVDATVELARQTDMPVIASGGVKGLDDIRLLSIHASDGIEGVITGRALYEGRLDLAAAIAMGARV